MEEERLRIVLEKETYREHLLSRVKEEQKALNSYTEEVQWSQLTQEYHKSYDTSGPKLSTFLNAFKEEPYEHS